MSRYFTDREFGERPRTVDAIDGRLWGGIHSLIDTRIGDGSFGYRFPEQCPDGRGPCGCDGHAFGLVLGAEVPSIEWPISYAELPDTPVILDLLEFCSGAVGMPVKGDFHPFFGHHHVSWDRDEGLARFVRDVNLLFARNAVAFELTPEGQARRLLPTPLAEALGGTVFATGDRETDRLLETARERIARPRIEDRGSPRCAREVVGCVRTAEDVGAGSQQADAGGEVAGRGGGSRHTVSAGPGRRGDGAYEDRKHVPDPPFRNQPGGSWFTGANRLSVRAALRVHAHGAEGDRAWRLI